MGFLGYIPILNVTTGQPTPTNTGIPTEDWAIRWEGIADWPSKLLNPLAVVNSILGFYYDHGTYLAFNADSDPGETPAGYTVDEWREITTNPQNHPQIVDIQKYGDTTYYTITPKTLPLVRPLHLIPFIGKPIADLIEPALRVDHRRDRLQPRHPVRRPHWDPALPVLQPDHALPQADPRDLHWYQQLPRQLRVDDGDPTSPTDPIAAPAPVDPMTSSFGIEQDQPEDNADDMSGARMSMMQDSGDPEQVGAEGEENQLLAQTETEGELTLLKEAPIEEAPIEEAPIQEAPIEEVPIEEVPIE